MPVFEYEARATNGKVLKGRVEAASEGAVISILRKQDYFPVSIRPYKESYNIDLSKFRRVSIKDISIFCRQFSVLITSGITIMAALDIVRNQTENQKLKAVLLEIFEDVQKGKTLSSAMDKHKEFPDMLVNMVEVGEASGTLDRIMDRVALYYEKEYKMQQKVSQALTYPVIVSIVSVVVVIFLVVKVIPTFAGMLSSTGGKLPLPTRIIMGLSSFIATKWYLLIGFIALISFGFISYKKSDRGSQSIDKLKLEAPVLGKVYRKIVTSRFARTFGLLTASGVPLLQSISICSNIVENAVIRKVLDNAKEEIKKGSSIGESLSETQYFPLMLTQMIKIGEETGTLDDVLMKTSDFYDNEVETATSQLTAMIEPLIIVVLGGIVAFIILSVILPMFNMYNSIGG